MDNLSHSEVWDDSILVQSWDSALKEYKKYHSIDAKLGQSNGLPDDGNRSSSVGKFPSDSEEVTVDESELKPLAVTLEHSSKKLKRSHSISGQKEEDESPLPIPDVQIPKLPLPFGPEGNESLRNLMISWYWAGYYTGYHEGQQSAKNSGTG